MRTGCRKKERLQMEAPNIRVAHVKVRNRHVEGGAGVAALQESAGHKRWIFKFPGNCESFENGYDRFLVQIVNVSVLVPVDNIYASCGRCLPAGRQRRDTARSATIMAREIASEILNMRTF